MGYHTHKLKFGPWFKWRKHLFDIHLYSLEEFNNFKHSKVCRLLTKLGLYTECYNSPIGIYLWLTSAKDFDKKAIENSQDNSLFRLAKLCELHLFQKAKCYGRIGTFLGILVTHEDNYYILMDEYGSKWCETCVGRIEFIKE